MCIFTNKLAYKWKNNFIEEFNNKIVLFVDGSAKLS